MTPQEQHVPTAIHVRPQWVGWRYETREGKKTKVPIDPHTGRRAKTNDPATWSDYETALAAVAKYGLEGVGYVFSADDPFTGIDIDDCRDPETGVIAEWAQEIIDTLATYTEVSPSGTGLKCWLAGAMTGTRHRWKMNGGEVEIYDQLRFFTRTGKHVVGTPLEIEERQPEFEALIARLDEQLAAGKAKAKSTNTTSKKPPASDDVVLKRLCRKDKYKRLLAGDFSEYDDDHSTADLVLAGAIAREVGADPERIDRIFRTTVLMREKWDEVHRADGASYGEMVIEKALDGLGDGGGKSATQKEILLAQAEDLLLYHTPAGEGFAVVRRGEHQEVMRITSKACGLWLRHQFWVSEGKAPSAATVKDALLTIEARANFEGEERLFGVRVMAYGDAIYLDLANEQWQAVKITAAGWEMVENPLLFRRGAAMRPLPIPEKGGDLRVLRRFVNVEGEGDFIVTVAWLVAALRPDGPYSILILQGEQGSAKTYAGGTLRSLVDPAAAALKSTPTKERDLMIAAVNSWIMGFDNLSGLTPAMSDAFCRLATGGGLSTRQLYSDADEITFEATRPITLNGIDDLSGRSDLLSRAIVITLPPFAAGKRRSEKELEAELAALRPGLLGALCDAVSTALRRLPEVKLDDPPRMADFAAWVVAAEPALPWKAGQFLAAYAANREAASELALEMDRFAGLLISMMRDLGSWSGTATDLLRDVHEELGQEVRSNDVPNTPRGLSNQLRRLAPLLRGRGLEVEFHKARTRTIVITNAYGPPDKSVIEGVRARVRKKPGTSPSR